MNGLIRFPQKEGHRNRWRWSSSSSDKDLSSTGVVLISLYTKCTIESVKEKEGGIEWILYFRLSKFFLIESCNEYEWLDKAKRELLRSTFTELHLTSFLLLSRVWNTLNISIICILYTINVRVNDDTKRVYKRQSINILYPLEFLLLPLDEGANRKATTIQKISEEEEEESSCKSKKLSTHRASALSLKSILISKNLLSHLHSEAKLFNLSQQLETFNRTLLKKPFKKRK